MNSPSSVIHTRSLKQMLLWALIATLVLSAVAAVYVFLFSEFGRTEVRILMTTLTISYFSVTSLACVAALEKRTHLWLSQPGVVLGLVGLCMFIPGIWADWFEHEAFGKTATIVAIFAFSAAQACLLSLVKLAPRVRWVFYAALALIFALAVWLSSLIVFEIKGDWVLRAIGVLAVLDGCASLSIPLLYRLERKEARRSAADRYDRIELACPRCGLRELYPVGEIQCRRCSLAIRVEIDHGTSAGFLPPGPTGG
jgi:hypothetical protein